MESVLVNLPVLLPSFHIHNLYYTLFACIYECYILMYIHIYTKTIPLLSALICCFFNRSQTPTVQRPTHERLTQPQLYSVTSSHTFHAHVYVYVGIVDSQTHELCTDLFHIGKAITAIRYRLKPPRQWRVFYYLIDDFSCFKCFHWYY